MMKIREPYEIIRLWLILINPHLASAKVNKLFLVFCFLKKKMKKVFKNMVIIGNSQNNLSAVWKEQEKQIPSRIHIRFELMGIFSFSCSAQTVIGERLRK